MINISIMVATAKMAVKTPFANFDHSNARVPVLKQMSSFVVEISLE